MKKDMVTGLVAGLVGGVLLGALIFSLVGKGNGKSPIGSNSVTSIPIAITEAKELDANLLARVEDMGITLDQYTNAYETLQRSLPAEQLAAYKQQESLFKAQVLENLINQNAVLAQVLKEGFLENPTNMEALQMALNGAIYQLYISQNAPTNTNAFTPSIPEIDQAYQQYGAQMRARGMTAQQSREFIVGQLSQQKQQLWMNNFITKVREGYRVERNSELISAQGISTNPLDAPAGLPPVGAP